MQYPLLSSSRASLAFVSEPSVARQGAAFHTLSLSQRRQRSASKFTTRRQWWQPWPSWMVSLKEAPQGARPLRSFEPKWLEPKWLEPKWLRKEQYIYGWFQKWLDHIAVPSLGYRFFSRYRFFGTRFNQKPMIY